MRSQSDLSWFLASTNHSNVKIVPTIFASARYGACQGTSTRVKAQGLALSAYGFKALGFVCTLACFLGGSLPQKTAFR